MNIQTQIGWFFSVTCFLLVACGAPVEDDMDFSDSTADEAPKKAKSDDADNDEVDDAVPEEGGLVVHGFNGPETIYPEADDFIASGDTLFVTDPATGRVYGQTPDGEWYPEGTDRISDEADEEIGEIIAEVESAEEPVEEETIERYAQVVTVENILPEAVVLQGAMNEVVAVFRFQNHWGYWNPIREVCFRNTGTGEIKALAGVGLDAFGSYADPVYIHTEDLRETGGAFCVEFGMTLGAEGEEFLAFSVQTPLGEALNDLWGTTYQFELTSIALESGGEVRGLPATTGLVSMERQ